MKYYVTTDIHGAYSLLFEELEKVGFFEDKEPHKLIICGDLFDRFKEERRMLNFILDLMDKNEVILLKGNHEDLATGYLKAIKDKTSPFDANIHFFKNGTVNTLLAFTDLKEYDLHSMTGNLAHEQLSNNAFIKRVIPAMKDYYETDNYIFVHGWIPAITDFGKNPNKSDTMSYMEGWRNATNEQWCNARWINGMDAWSRGVKEPNKTIVCGHWHTSYGHSKLSKEGPEFGSKANFGPFIAPGIIALDACTAYSNKVNVIIIED